MIRLHPPAALIIIIIIIIIAHLLPSGVPKDLCQRDTGQTG
jgi:hypothetical protein